MDTAQPVQTPAKSPVVQPAATYASNPVELLKPSLHAFKLIWLRMILLIVGLILAFTAIVVGYAFANLAGAGALVNVALFLLAMVVAVGGSIYVNFALTKLTIGAARGNKLTFKQMMPSDLSTALKYLVTTLMSGIVIIFGFLLFIIPGFIFLAWFIYAPYLTVDEGVWGIAALKRSRDLSRGRNWDVLGTVFLPATFAILLIIPFIGWIAYTVLALIAIPLLAVRYNSLLELKKQPGWESVRTHPLNYLVFALGLIFGGVNQYTSFQKLQSDQAPLEINSQPY